MLFTFVVALISVVVPGAVGVRSNSSRDAAQWLIDKYSTHGTFEYGRFVQNIAGCERQLQENTATTRFDCGNDRTCQRITQCTKNITFDVVDADDLRNLCPLLLIQADTNACCNVKVQEQKLKPDPTEVWGYGFLFVTLISLCSLVGVSVMPLMGKAFYHQLLTALVGLAVGSLSASSVFHLIPQAFNLLETDTHHTYLNASLLMWGGIWIFFMTERILKIIMEAKQGNEHTCNSKPLNSSISGMTFISPEERDTNHSSNISHGKDANGKVLQYSCIPSDSGAIYECQEQAIKASFGHKEKPRPSHGHEQLVQFQQGRDSAIAVVAWMIIFGDGLHNFIDGLSIGAAFNQSILTGVSISVAVMCEEFPHELGDFAVLLNSGMKMRQALMYNFLSACTCYVGLIIGILLGEIEASVYIFGFAAGMFLYISLVDMVPEMNEVVEEASKVSWKKAVKVLILQNIGLFIGVTILYLLARYQDQIQF